MPDNKKQYIRRVNSFLFATDRLVNRESRDIINLLKDSRNEITQRIRNLNATEWQMWRLPQLRAEIDNRLEEMTSNAIAIADKSSETVFDFALNKADELNKSIGVIPPAVRVSRELLDASSTLTGELIKTIKDDVLKKAMNKLSLGIMQGKSQSQVARELSNVYGVTFSQAQRIVRTEYGRTLSLAQEKRNQQVVEENPDMKKIWIWSKKPNGREGHAEAERNTFLNPVDPNKPFLVRSTFNSPFEELRFPRDPMGSAENTINCGCTHALVSAEISQELAA